MSEVISTCPNNKKLHNGKCYDTEPGTMPLGWGRCNPGSIKINNLCYKLIGTATDPVCPTGYTLRLSDLKCVSNDNFTNTYDNFTNTYDNFTNTDDNFTNIMIFIIIIIIMYLLLYKKQ